MPDPHPFKGIGLRTLSAVVLAAAAIAATLAGGASFLLLVGLGVALMAREWPELCLAGAGARPLWRPRPPLAAVGFVALAVLALGLLVAGRLREAIALAIAGALVVAAFAQGLSARDRLLLGLGLPYIIVPAAALLFIAADRQGSLTVLWLFAVVWTTDIGGYLAGKSIGGPKLAPAISPNKTWAGAIGGTLLAAATAAGFALVVRSADALHLALTGGILSMVAQAGDLLESAVKRHFAVKDSGSIIPG
ncbi:MAG: Phosphatidate cytidylyltransferase, partial [Pseudomonadota bacterium]